MGVIPVNQLVIKVKIMSSDQLQISQKEIKETNIKKTLFNGRNYKSDLYNTFFLEDVKLVVEAEEETLYGTNTILPKRTIVHFYDGKTIILSPSSGNNLIGLLPGRYQEKG